MTAIRAAIQAAIRPAIYVATAGGGSTVWTPASLFAASEVGVWYDPSDFSTMFQDSGGTTPVTAIGDPVGKILDKSGNGNHASQATAASRPILGRTPATGQRNLLLATDTLSTQNKTVTAVAHTLSFTGTGTVTLSGTSTAGPLVGTGVSDRVSLTFTPTAGTLTLTVSGSVTLAQLELGSSATAYQKVTAAYDVTEAGVADCYNLWFDGVDDYLSTAAVNFSATSKLSIFTGVRKASDAAGGSVLETSPNYTTAGGFAVLAPSGAAAANYSFGMTGATGAQTKATAASYAAPATNVLSAALDIAQLSYAGLTARVNGAAASLTPGGAGVTSIGTFANAALFVGSRGGALPFKGSLHSLVVLGRTATALEIAAAESYVAGKTGVVLP